MNPRKRYSTVSNTVIDNYPYFISELIERTEVNSKIIAKDFSLISIIKLLDCLKSDELSAKVFFMESGIYMKRSFLNYTSLCLKFGFIKKERGDTRFRRGGGKMVYYSITEKGKILLDLFNHES